MEKSQKKSREHLVLGVMSGTSLDGLDLALCVFSGTAQKPAFKILSASTISYPAIWKQRLDSMRGASAEKFFAIDALYAAYVAEHINTFLAKSKAQPLAIASHGHTVFHQPQTGFSTQAGNGAIIAAHTGITTVCDFRSLDVGLGGQGAPLVPLGDKLLFGSYQACLNLGGIANISYDKKEKRIAYDICVTNMLLNFLAEGLGMDYDVGGRAARSGKVNRVLLDKLDAIEYYGKAGAKSIGREWFEKHLLKYFEKSRLGPEDLLATATEHIADIIGRELDKQKIKKVLVTGGGAFNDFLIERIREKCKAEVILPDAEIINFKEALIFAFLGYLRLNQRHNTLASVTGASRDSVGGAVYYGAR